LAFTLITLALFTYAIRETQSPATVLRAFGVLIIIAAAVFLVVVGYNQAQISPVIGLLGTIAGYLLGKGEDRPSRVVSREEYRRRTGSVATLTGPRGIERR